MKNEKNNVDRGIHKTELGFILLSYQIIRSLSNRWEGSTQDQGRWYHMETSLPNSLSCFSFNPSIQGALGSNYHLSTGLILQIHLPEHGLLRTFVEGVTEWAFPLSIWRLEIRCVAIYTTSPSCVATANRLRCGKFFLYPHLYSLWDCQTDTRYFQKNNLNLVVDFLTALLLFIVRFVKTAIRNRTLSYILTHQWHVVITLTLTSLQWMEFICTSKHRNSKVK